MLIILIDLIDDEIRWKLRVRLKLKSGGSELKTEVGFYGDNEPWK